MYVDWPTKVIYIPKADLTLVQLTPIEIRELNLDTFRLTLKDLEDGEEGMHFQTTHNHNPPVNIGGVTLARVVEIINDYTVTFEDGAYAVNLVGANSNVADRLNLNQVSVRAANSAGLVQSREIEYASFQNAVWYDPLNGSSGTLYPTGTPQKPVNNFTDAQLIMSLRGFRRINILENSTLNSLSFDEVIFTAPNTVSLLLTMTSGATVNNCRFEDMDITGMVNGTEVNFTKSRLINLTFQGGYLESCVLDGTTTITGSDSTFLVRCGDANPSLTPATFDLSVYSGELTFAEYIGDLRFINKSSATPITININGHVTLESTVTAGTFIITGIGKLTNNSTGTTVVNTSSFINNDDLILMKKILQNKSILNSATGKQTIYDDDGTTPLVEADVFEDAAGAVPYDGTGAVHRRERLE